MQELFSIVYPGGEFETRRGLTAAQVSEHERQSKGGTPWRAEHYGYLTTIREYAPTIAAESKFPSAWLDEPLAAVSLGEHSVLCSGRAVVGFYDPRQMPTRRPAYIVVNTHPSYGPLGLTLVQSA